MCNKNNSSSKVDKNFEEVIEILKLNKINYWLCHGTLLGIIRDNNLIPWDHDVDIAVWQDIELKKKFMIIMRENNYRLKQKYFINDDLLTFVKDGGREIDINFYERKLKNGKEIAFVKWCVPKNFLMKFIEAISQASYYSGKGKFFIKRLIFLEKIFEKIKKMLIVKGLFYRFIGYTQPYELLKQFKEIKFHNILVNVPFKHDEYLSYVYGSDWKKQKKKFNWITDSPSTEQV